MAIKVVHEPEPKPGSLGKPELYALAIGQVIGAGVITLIVPAIKMTGYSAWLAYFAAIIMGFVMILPTVFVSSTVRMGGGNYSMLCGLAGPNIAGIYAFSYLTQCLSLSLFGASAAAYLGDIIPALSGHLPRVIVGAALLTFFFVVNLMGIDIMASAQKLMTWLLIAALILFAVVGIARMKLPIFDFSDPNFLINGWGITFENGQISGGFIGATLLFVYSTQGYYMTTAYGGDSKNARRDIPIVLLLAVPHTDRPLCGRGHGRRGRHDRGGIRRFHNARVRRAAHLPDSSVLCLYHRRSYHGAAFHAEFQLCV